MAERDEQLFELPLDTPGERLKRARERVGFSLADVSGRTKIAERHLISIESGNYGALASRAYAVGFARSYARAVGLDEQEIVNSVRDVMDGLEPGSDRQQVNSFEPGDPARVPSSRLAWLAALGGLAVVFAGFYYWRSYYAPAQPLPNLTAEPTPVTDASLAPVTASDGAAATALPVATPAAPTGGPVVFTALEAGVWVKFYDGSGKQLIQKQMAMGESYAVPPEAVGPMIWTGRPDALQITVDGRPVAKLAEREGRIKDMPVTAAALLARPPATPAAIAPAAPALPVPAQSSPVSQ